MVLPPALEIIGYRAFMDNPLASVVIPASVTEFVLNASTGQGDHFNNTPLARIYTDAGNASTLAAMLDDVVMGDITASTTSIVVDGTVIYTRNSNAATPVWTAA